MHRDGESAAGHKPRLAHYCNYVHYDLSAREERGDGGQYLGIDAVLRAAGRRQLGLPHDERVISAGDDVQDIRRTHLRSYRGQQSERTQRITRPLNEEHARRELAQDLVANGSARRLQWITEAEDSIDLLFEAD